MRLWSFDRWTIDTPIVKHARAAVRNGFAVVFLRPGGKEPLCPLTARERKRAGVDHPCGVSHASTDERWVVRKATQLEKDYGRINLGIAAHASGVVVIDADTPEQVESVQEFLRQLGEDAAILAEQPTVRTPGSQRNGVWVHSQGTHWYFNRPDELDLPQYPGEMHLVGGAVMRWGNSYTLVPPSERAEGPYISLAEYICDVPIGLVAMIRAHVETKTQRMADLGERFANDAIVRWSLEHPWHALLEPDGWGFTGKLDRQCNCPVWKRPGEDTSTDRSAIAHEDDCTRLPNIEGHGALYIFSDNPPGLLAERVAAGQRTFTKLQYVALTRYDGDELAAKIGEGIEIDFASRFSDTTDEEPSEHSDNAGDPYAHDGTGQKEKGSDQGVSTEEEQLVDLVARLAAETGYDPKVVKRDVAKDAYDFKRRRGVTNIVGASTGDSSSWAPVSAEAMLQSLHRDRSAVNSEGVLIRSDGATLWPTGQVHQIFGQSSAGKTFCGMKAMFQQTQLGQRVLYCDFEDTLDTFIDRYYVDLGLDIEPLIATGLLQYCNPLDAPDDFTALVEAQYRMVLVDSMTEVLSSINESSINDALLIRRVMHAFRHLAVGGASVLIINHGSEKVDVPGSAMGSSNFRSGLTGQDVLLHEKITFDNRHAGRSLLYIAKDRGSKSAGDADLDLRANKVQRKLWGAMEVTPTYDELLERWVTAIEIEPATHQEQEPPKERKIDVAERLVIDYLRHRPEESAVQARMIDDIVDENDGVAERTVRRAIQQLEDDGMLHATGQEESIGGRPSPVIKLGPKP